MSKEVVHISQFYPCSKISIASELFYICELGKYLSDYNKCISLDGVILDNVLKSSRFWDYLRVSSSNGWVTDLGLSQSGLEISIQNPVSLETVKNIHITEDEVKFNKSDSRKREEDLMYKWTTPQDVQVFFTSKSDDTWIWTIKGNSFEEEMVNSKSLNSLLPSQSFVSLTAYIAVKRFNTGVPNKFVIKFDSVILCRNKLTTSDILLLANETDALDGWFFLYLEASEQVKLQTGYEAWWYKGYEKGFLRREYSTQEKLSYLNKLGIKVGDVVCLYERRVSQKSNSIKSIENFHMAIVEGFDSECLDLRVIHTKKTKHGWDKWFDNLTMAVKQMYCGSSSYKDFRSSVKGYEWRNLGLEYLMSSEQFFITPLQNNDSLVLDVTDGVRQETYNFSDVDAIYWILKDYNINFNEEHFLSQYYNGTEPAYTRYMRGEDITNTCELLTK